MARAVLIGVLVCILTLTSGCIAVSAREIHHGLRYEAVVTPDGTIYVVDTENLSARRVRSIIEADDDDG